MRHRAAAFKATAVFALVLAGCERSPTNPSLAMDGPQLNATVIHSESKVPVSFSVFIPCANGGAGETAVVSAAELHVISRIVFAANGNIHISTHFQPMKNWNGIGETTGDVYVANGVTREHVNFSAAGFPLQTTLVNNFRWTGKGRASNLSVHTISHMTINSNGDVTVAVDKTAASCG